MPFVYFMFFALSLTALACPPAGPLGDDATDAYVRLLRHLVTEKRLPADVAARIADAEAQTNPLEADEGQLLPTQAHVFREAFASRLREGVDWARVRDAAREIARTAGHESENRDVAKKATVHLPILGPIIPDLHRSIGLTPPPETVTIKNHVAKDGTAYLVEISNGGDGYAFRIENGKIKSHPLPPSTVRAEIIEGKNSTYAVCATKGGGASLLDLSTGAITRAIPGPLEENDKFFIRDQSLGVIAGDTLRLYPLAGGAPVVRELPKGDFKHLPGENGDEIFTYGFVEEAGVSKVVVMNGETGTRHFEKPLARPIGTLDTSVRLFQDAAGRPMIAAQGTGGKVFLVDNGGARTREVSEGKPVLLYSALVKGPDGRRTWVAETRNETTKRYDLLAIDLEKPQPLRFEQPTGDLSHRFDIIAGNGHPLAIYQSHSYEGRDSKNRIHMFDLYNGEKHVIEIDAEKYHLFRGVTIGRDGAVLAIYSWPGGRGNARALIQIYGPPHQP